MGLVLNRRLGEVLVVRHRSHDEVLTLKLQSMKGGRLKFFIEGDDYEVLREELVDKEEEPDDVRPPASYFGGD